METIKRVHRGKSRTLNSIIGSLSGLTPAETSLIIAMGGAYVGKYRCKDGSRLIQDGELVAAFWRLPLVMEPVPFDPSWVISDGPDLLLAGKPQGLPTQGRRDADYMAFYELLKGGLSGYLALHHRLDQDTSGLMLFCRDKRSNKYVAELFQERLVDKRYLAVAQGTWAGEAGRLIDAPIGPQREPRGVRHRVLKGGKPAQTEVQLIAREGDLLLLDCRPKTGRTHQIRVHLAHIGCPLLGDALYGQVGKEPFLLHCYQLGWPKRGTLPGGRKRLGVPEPWRTRLPKTLVAAYDTWWEEAAC